ncbi:MAG: hypothetical protein WKF87_06805 [Chryseolinea sp.]
MNNTVLTTSGGCGCSGGAGGLNLAPVIGDGANIIVRHKPGITVGNYFNELNEGGVKIYELVDKNLALPTVAFSNNAPVAEVGQTIAEVIFTGLITAGSNAVASRSISPAVDGLNLFGPFNFNILNVKRNTAGAAEGHTVQAIDSEGNARSVASSVAFKQAMYHGFSALAALDQDQIKALAKVLKDSIIQQYGGVQNYVVPGSPATPKYIYWYGAVGTPSIAGAVLGGLSLPLVDVPPVTITNVHDATILTPYWGKRTANKLDPGTYAITIS